jgi:hypothetical protein
MYGPVAALALLVAGYSVYWQASAKALAAELDQANGKEVMPGITFAFAEKEVGGFPFRLDAVLDGVTFVHHGSDGETAWRTEKLALHMLSYGANHFLFEATGLQTFDWPGADGKPRVLYLTPGAARASAILRDGKLSRFDLDLMELQAKDADPQAVPGRDFSADRAQFHLRSNADNTLDAAVRLEGGHIGPGYEPALGPDLPLFTFEGSLSHSETLDALRAGADSFANAAENWRAAKGALDISEITLDWGDLYADGKITLALDSDHRLAGSAEGFITDGKALVTAKAISVLAGTSEDAQGRTPATVVLQNGEMRLGKTRLETLTPVY